MANNYFHNRRVLGVLERSRLNEPDVDTRFYEHCKCCGDPIYDHVYKLDGEDYCYDCAHEMCRIWLIDEESIECEGCGESITEGDCYYSVSGEPYCEDCFEKYFQD